MKEYVAEEFLGLDKAYEEISHVFFEDCVFENCKFENVNFLNVRFHGCVFRNCRVLACKVKNVQALGNSFIQCTLSGINWADVLDERKRAMNFLPFDVLSQCTLRYNIFFGLSLRKFDFSKSDLSGSFFDECDLTEANFQQCNLEGTSFSHNNLTSADFRNAIRYLFSVQDNRCSKARFTLPDAVNLLAALDIVIDDG